MVFLDILVVCEHLSPEVDAKSRIDWGCWGFSWAPFFFRFGRGGGEGESEDSSVASSGGSCGTTTLRTYRRLGGASGAAGGEGSAGGKVSMGAAGVSGASTCFFGLPLRFGSAAGGKVSTGVSAGVSVTFFPLRFGCGGGASTVSTSAISFFEIRYENFTTAVDQWRRLPSSGRLVS